MKSANLRRVTIFGLIAAISLIVAACGSSKSTTTTSTVKAAALPVSWELPGANAQNTRDVGGPINSANVGDTRRRMDGANRGERHLWCLRDDARCCQWRPLHPGPRVERVCDQPNYRQAAVDKEVQLSG